MFQAEERHDNGQAERRRSPAIIAFGRFMLPDTSEHTCQVSQMTADRAVFSTTSMPPIGTEIVAYVDDIGRVEAISGEPVNGGFKVHFVHRASRRERFEQRITWLAKKTDGAIDQRRHARCEPKNNKSQITMPDGRVHPCEVIDISLSGAAVNFRIKPVLGTYLMLGKVHGRVVRHFDNGFALEFTRQLSRTTHNNWVNGRQDTCATIGCRTGFSNPTTTSSPSAVTPGTNSSTARGRSYPSVCATGHIPSLPSA